jgi:hypothetical protein
MTMKSRCATITICIAFGIALAASCRPVSTEQEYAAMSDRLQTLGVPVVSLQAEVGVYGNTVHAVVQLDSETPCLMAWVYVLELHREVYVSRHERHLDLDCIAFEVLDAGGEAVESGDILIRDYNALGLEPPLTKDDDEVAERIRDLFAKRGVELENLAVWRDSRGFRRARLDLQAADGGQVGRRLEVDEYREEFEEELNDAGAQIAVLYVNVNDPDGGLLLRYVCDFQCASEAAGHVVGIHPWWSVPVAGACGSSSLIEPEVPFHGGISGGDQYLLGELVEYGELYSNPSSRPITIDPYPPAWWVRSVDRDVVVYSSEAGDRTLELEPGDSSGPSFGLWWLGEEADWGKEITPGLYEITHEYVVYENSTGKTYTVTASFQFELVASASARSGDLEVNQAVTAEGLTVTLEHLQMDAVEATAYTFTTPQGYELPENGPPYEYETFGMHSRAEYSIDGAAPTELKGSGGKFTEDGIALAWDGIEPIPVDAREFSFVITRLGDVDGRWEFTVQLD